MSVGTPIIQSLTINTREVATPTYVIVGLLASRQHSRHCNNQQPAVKQQTLCGIFTARQHSLLCWAHY